MSDRRRILVCDDEPQILRALKVILREAGFEPVPAETVEEALDAAAVHPPDAAIVDLVLPDGDGVDVLRGLREWSQMPVLVLSAVGDEEAKVRALEAGADDYVTKPFGVAELLARLEAALRRPRARRAAQEIVRIGAVEADFRAHRLSRAGVALEVTAHEMKLLEFLLRHEGALLSRQQILDGVWGADYYGTERTVDNFVNRLRSKIEVDPRAPTHLVTVRGGGYRFTR